MIGSLTIATKTFLLVRETSFSRSNKCRASVKMVPPSYTCKSTPSLYEVLRLKNNASPMDIKVAYRNLAKVYHPDSSQSNSSDCHDFIKIHEAYSMLSDPASRKVYDLTLAIGSGIVYSVDTGECSGFSRRWETDQCW